MNRKVCLITGAGRGIGRATAMEMSKRGWDLALIARTQAELDETIRLAGGGMSIRADVTRPEQVQQAVNEALRRFERIDAAVTCAGAAPLAPIEKTTDEQFRLAVDSNLAHAFYVTRALWPQMKTQGGGVFVNVSSLAARDPFDGFGAYGAAKAGINVFSLVAAHEGAPHNIRVHVVAPGAVETQMLRQNFPESMLPAEQTLQPAEVAKVIAQCITGDLHCTSGEVIWVHK